MCGGYCAQATRTPAGRERWEMKTAKRRGRKERERGEWAEREREDELGERRVEKKG